jgi:hypothetical protein
MENQNTSELNTIEQQTNYLKNNKKLNNGVQIVYFPDLFSNESLSFKQEKSILNTLEKLGFESIGFITDPRVQLKYENYFDSEVLSPDEVKKKTVFPEMFDAIIVVNSVQNEVKHITPKLNLGTNRLVICIQKYMEPKLVKELPPQYGYNDTMAEKDELQAKMFGPRN